MKNTVKKWIASGNMPLLALIGCAKRLSDVCAGKYFSFIILIFLAFVFCHCSKNGELQRIPVVSHLYKIEDIPIEDFVSSVRKVQLETNDSILVSKIYKIFETTDFFIVMHLFRISVFDKEGRYLHDISHRGQGPHEFNAISSIFIKDNLFYLYDVSHREVSIFTLGGDFVRSFSIEKYYDFIFPLQNNDYVAFQTNISGKEKAKLIFFDESGGADTIFYNKEYEKAENVLFIFDMEGYVYNYDDRDYFKELYNDTLFAIQPNYTLVPRLTFDLGGYQPSLERKHTLTDVNYGWEDMAHLSIIGETNSYLFFNILNNLKTHTYYWDKHRKSLHNVRFVYPKSYGYEGSFVPKAISENKQNLISIEYDTIGDNNPTIIIATLKE